MSQPNLTIQLHVEEENLKEAKLHFFPFEEGDSNSCILICPGGGYGGVSKREWGPVAAWINSMGISAAVLEYTTGRNIYPKPQQQGLYAMRLLRKRSTELKIDPARIGVIGFSAGGHLSATLSNGFDRSDWLVDPDKELEGISARPDLAILSYPVITSGPFQHKGSFTNLLGEEASEEDRDAMSMEKAVHEKTPPTFLWHTVEDVVVPVENAYLYAMALNQHGVEHELHVFPTGIHGLSICRSPGKFWNDHVRNWLPMAEAWLGHRGFWNEPSK